MCDSTIKTICLAHQSQVTDRNGLPHVITRIEIHAAGYLPDLYVRFDRKVLDHALYDDSQVIAHVMAILRNLGYSGAAFDRAELGMQGARFIVLEPPRAFSAFVVHAYGWRDLAESAKAY